MRFHGNHFGFAGSRPRIGTTALALLLAGVASGSAVYSVRAQSAPPEDKATQGITITSQTPGDSKDGDQTKLRSELDSLLRERMSLDSRIASLRSRLGARSFFYVRPSVQSEKLTTEQRKRAEEAIRKAQDEVRRAEQAVRDAERAVPGTWTLHGNDYRFFQGSPLYLPPMAVPAIPPIPPMPEMKLWTSPDIKSFNFNWNNNAWSDKDRAAWDKWTREYTDKWKAWSQEWEKSHPEFEKQMRDYQEKMKQWQKSFQDQWHGSLDKQKETPEAKEKADSVEKEESKETPKQDDAHTSEDISTTPPVIQPI